MRGPLAWLAGALATILLLVALAVRLERPAAAPPLAAELDVAAAMRGGDPAGFRRAEAPRPFDFPADHGAHDGFRTEWWYFTGTLVAGDGRTLGYQLTFFRNALAPEPAAGTSNLRAQHVWMAHFALSDGRRGRFRFAEKLAREAIGLAGARAVPFAVWVEGWSAATTGSGFAPLELVAAADGMALELTLDAGKPPVLQGDRGWSRKGPEPGNASFYYSLTRMPTRGTVELDGERFEVAGNSWMDREWSTSALGPGLAGWDWLALQLDDGRDLMLYRLRRRDGAADPWSAGRLIEPDGASRPLAAAEFRFEPLGRWASPRGGVYPAGFRVEVPGEGLELEARPRVADQELATLVRYWEGAVAVSGTGPRGPVSGAGFLEMTGYATGAGALALPR